MSEWVFCDFTLRCLAPWALQYQVLIAGCLATFGGLCALVAAFVVRDGTITVAQASATEGRRAAAAAFWAELNQCCMQMRVDAYLLTGTRPWDLARVPAQQLVTPIFDGDAGAVGKLDPREAFAVVTTYNIVRELNLEYAATTAAGFEPDSHRARALGKRATDASNVIEKTLRGFGQPPVFINAT